ncbi:MAG: hypothetical protein AB8U25_04415 [Rickettsiales endosymbiont of Dermacentor nuttalli]
MNNVGGIHTNTAFNRFRNIAALNNLNGVKKLLTDLTNNLPKGEGFDKALFETNWKNK